MKLISYIEAHGLTQAEFARKIGANVMAISRYCRGEQIPRPNTMRRIVEATDGAVKPSDFYDFSEAAE